MEKLNIQLENPQLRPQLDWIIDRASETNFNYPTVSILSSSSSSSSSADRFCLVMRANDGAVALDVSRSSSYSL